MSQTPENPATPAVIEDYLPILNIPGIGPAVIIPTTRSVKFAEGVTLKAALDAMAEQITASAAAVGRMDADLADIITWLTEQFGYVKQDHQTGGSYLTPLFTELPKAPTGEGEL